MFKVWLDFGHGGSDSGATNDYAQEKNINLVVGMEAKKLLLLNGFQVGTSRESDVFVDLTTRCNMANSWGADMFESIHHNSGGGDGAETIFSIYHGEGEKLANEIMDQFKAIGQNCRRVFSREGDNKKDYYAVIRQTDMPAVISEFGFMDTVDYEAFDTQEKLLNEATAIAKGICIYCNVLYVPYVTPIVEEVKIMEPELTFDEALQIVKSKVDIDVEYWKQAEEYEKYIDALFIKFAEAIK